MSIINIKRVVAFAALCISWGVSLLSQAQVNPDVPESLRSIVARNDYDAPLTEQQHRALSPLISDAMIKIFGVDSLSKEAEYIRNLVTSGNPAERAVAPGDKTPIAHYRFKDGSALPGTAALKEQENKAALMLAKLQLDKEVQKGALEALSSGPNKPEEPTKVISKPACGKSSSSELSIPEGFLAQGKPLDILFFEGKPPFDIKTGIGKNTVVISFGEADSAAIAAPFSNLEIDCVPFRLRSTGSKVTYSKGALALKNYDANEEADGTFDPTVKKYIQQNNIGG